MIGAVACRDDVLVLRAWHAEAQAEAILVRHLGSETVGAALGTMRPSPGSTRGPRAERLRELARPLLAGDDALRQALVRADGHYWEMVCGHLRLIHIQARRLHARHPAAPLDDVDADLRVTWWRAALRYQPGRGAKFSTYASWWVRAWEQDALRRRGAQEPAVVELPVGEDDGRGAGIESFGEASDLELRIDLARAAAAPPPPPPPRRRRRRRARRSPPRTRP